MSRDAFAIYAVCMMIFLGMPTQCHLDRNHRQLIEEIRKLQPVTPPAKP